MKKANKNFEQHELEKLGLQLDKEVGMYMLNEALINAYKT